MKALLSVTCRYNLDPDEIRDELVWAEYKMITDNEKETQCAPGSKQARAPNFLFCPDYSKNKYFFIYLQECEQKKDLVNG